MKKKIFAKLHIFDNICKDTEKQSFPKCTHHVINGRGCILQRDDKKDKIDKDSSGL